MLYKVLNEDGKCHHGGKGKWNLPTQNEDGSWTPGEWMPAIEGELVLCANGYHGCKDEQVLNWLGPAVYEMEGRGDHLDGDDKSVYREARLLRRLNWDHAVAVACACDCAEHVLPIFEARFPNDKRPRQAIAAARGGDRVAARAAAYAADAAHAAAHAAARAAADAAYAAHAAADAAYAAYAADAAYAAYAAARAADDAACAAARAAYAAYAADAAYAAADAAAYAAYAAERRWQYERLCWYLEQK